MYSLRKQLSHDQCYSDHGNIELGPLYAIHLVLNINDNTSRPGQTFYCSVMTNW